jgi:hypothetical protein
MREAEKRIHTGYFGQECEENRAPGICVCSLEDNVEMDVKHYSMCERERERVSQSVGMCTALAWGAILNKVMDIRVP